MADSKISVILPVYNEESVLRKNVKRLEEILKKLFDDFEIIISEDGSTDRSLSIARSLESTRIRTVHNGRRNGKGAAIKAAAEHATGEIIIFMDADLASNPEDVEELAKHLEDGAAIVIGSRYLPDSRTKRDAMRYLASKSFNWLVRNLLGSKLSDHQCGFKAFRKDLVMPILERIEDKQWFWDTELLVLAQRNGLRITEIPVEWKEGLDSKFNLLKDTVNMGCRLARFKLKKG